ncbi:MAG: prenyltransferase/squalene oxidase repeat-containing protein, partial [Planctomycetota bacterium]
MQRRSTEVLPAAEKRWGLWLLVVVVSLLASPAFAQSRSKKGHRVGVGMDRRTNEAVEQALSYLAERQNPIDGSWEDRVGRKVYTTYRGRIAPHVGVTALCGVAFLSNGVVPGGGPPGRFWKNGKLIDSKSYRNATGRRVTGSEIVNKALDFVISQTSATGYIRAHGSRMYSHAFASLFLAEAYGMGYTRGGKLRAALRRSIAMIEGAQNVEGGWRYRPQAQDSDMSITVCQVIALRAARNSGISVGKKTIDKAVQYVQQSFLPSVGAFTYQLGPEFRNVPSRHSFALTAAGVTTLYGAGVYSDSDMIRRAVAYMWQDRPPPSKA